MVSGEEFIRTIYELGGEQNASTSHDSTGYFETLASDRTGVPIDFESDRMSNLVLRESDFRTERMVVERQRSGDVSSVMTGDYIGSGRRRRKARRLGL
jgi:zinc protease